MKTTAMKTLAMLGLSACILVGSAVSGFAAEPSGSQKDQEECEHKWKYETEVKNTCIETSYLYRNADGTTQTITLCPACGQEGKVGVWDPDNAQLREVTGVSSNFSNLTVHTGTLHNGMNVMTVAFYYPEKTEKRICELCKLVETLDHSDSRFMASDIEASISLPKEVVENYDLMLVNADGTETKLDVSLGEKQASLTLNMASGAQLIHLVAKG